MYLQVPAQEILFEFRTYEMYVHQSWTMAATDLLWLRQTYVNAVDAIQEICNQARPVSYK